MLSPDCILIVLFCHILSIPFHFLSSAFRKNAVLLSCHKVAVSSHAPPGAARALVKPLVSLCSSGTCGTSLTSTAGGLALEDLTGRCQEVQGLQGQPMSATGDRQSEIEHCLAKAPRNGVGIAQDVQVKDCSAPLSVGTSKSHHFIPCAATCCLF